MSKLYDLRDNWKQVEEMLYEEEIDEQCILDTLESIEGEIEDKADNYAMIIKNLLASAEAKRAEIKKMSEKAKVEENRAQLLKDRLEEVMRETGKTKFKTQLFSFNIQKNGGKEPLWTTEDLRLIPWDFLKKEPDNTRIRELLATQEVSWARLEPRGESLVIR